MRVGLRDLEREREVVKCIVYTLFLGRKEKNDT
jgi:hypothetical protein